MPYAYALLKYGRIISDVAYREGYQEAIRRVVKPGDVVLDLGSGTGFMGLIACQAGARRVYAVEPNYIIQMAKELAAANGYADRVEFIQALSTQITLPEPVNVIVSDLHGALPFFEAGIQAIIDARRRFLAPGGKLIPRREILWGAVAEAPDLYQGFVAPWKDNPYGLNLAPALQLATHFWEKAQIKPTQLLVAPEIWGTLDYSTLESPHVMGELNWQVARRGTGHGLVIWFDADLAPGVSFSTAPGSPIIIFTQGFFPWSEPVDLAVGDRVTVSLAANLVEDDYIWRWDTHIRDAGGQVKANFRQSTFYTLLESQARLRQRAVGHVPELSEDGRMDRFILELMDGKASLGDIARRLVAEFPHRFASDKEALTRAGELSLKYGRPLPNRYIKNT
jgi:protein arginine N-methyltransferase 1